MKIVSGSFNGTGATLTVSVGFVPDEVRLFNMEVATNIRIEWNRNMRAKEFIEGILEYTGTTYRQIVALTVGTGVKPYRGGDILTSSLQTSTAYGEGVYLSKFDKDVRFSDSQAVNPGGASGTTISKWTLDTSGNRTGHFNANLSGVTAANYIAEGSRIKIDGKWYVIQALTSAATSTADYVELSEAAPSGVVEFIEGYATFAPTAVGKVTAPGFTLSTTSPAFNVNDELIAFEAIQWDD